MTFDKLCERLTELGGEEVNKDMLEGVFGDGSASLMSGASRSRCYLFKMNERGGLATYFAIPSTATQLVAVVAAEEEGQGVVALLGHPYLDFSLEKTFMDYIFG